MFIKGKMRRVNTKIQYICFLVLEYKNTMPVNITKTTVISSKIKKYNGHDRSPIYTIGSKE